jgi:hypothetical protein
MMKDRKLLRGAAVVFVLFGPGLPSNAMVACLGACREYRCHPGPGR